MDVITFEIGDVTIQIVAGEICFWADGTDHPPDIELPIGKLQDVLNAARTLRKDETTPEQIAKWEHCQQLLFVLAFGRL